MSTLVDNKFMINLAETLESSTTKFLPFRAIFHHLKSLQVNSLCKNYLDLFIDFFYTI